MKKKCYIYTRVSTIMQVDGYSLDAQKNRLRKYADAMDMQVCGEYSDEGKSGKNVDGRPEFKQMIHDIETNKDNVGCVLVFKLSRFGRNAADVLSTLQFMEDFGCSLTCVEDGIDSSKDSGKLIISVLSSVAEMERNNILVQTMEGRKQKAREGKWNGGMAPYGYYLEKGMLKVKEDEAKVVRLIFDKYANTTMGLEKIALFLNDNGYSKSQVMKNSMNVFSTTFITKVIDNPIYKGKIAYGRRTNQKIKGSRNEYHIVKADDYMVCDGVHDAIVSEELWEACKKKREDTTFWKPKCHSLEHEHLLSSILKCPVCGAGMYGNVNRKKSKKNNTYYKDSFFYCCKHRIQHDGQRCSYHRQWNQKYIDDAVIETIKMVVKNKKFASKINEIINSKVDVETYEEELITWKKKYTNAVNTKDRILREIDILDYEDKHYARMYQDYQNRLSSAYDELDLVEEHIDELETKIENINQNKINATQIYNILLSFDKIFDKLTAIEKKTFLNRFIAEVNIFEERRSDRRVIKSIKFRFPIYFKYEMTEKLEWDSKSDDESVTLLSLKEPKNK